MKSLVTVALTAVLTLIAAPGAQAATRLPVPYNLAPGLAQQLVAPDSPPPGANNWSCLPSAAHPNPVVLTHGLAANQTVNWQTFAPLLANHGYCVFSLTYGIPGAPAPIYQPGGLTRMEQSAAEFSAFVDRVLASTGASKVDILGHSEGTLMPSYYVKFLGGSAKVGKYVSLTPLWAGTTLLGLSTLYQFVEGLGLKPVIDGVLNPICESCAEMLHGSDFLAKLHSGNGIFAPEVTYTNIVTRYDELVAPYTSGLGTGPNVHNIVLQDRCALDFAEHLGVATDRNAAAHVLNALDPTHAGFVPCLPAGPLGS
jgi:triacylglycerol esterase/lipase EstA (alpha/beta hydrolase family)